MPVLHGVAVTPADHQPTAATTHHGLRKRSSDRPSFHRACIGDADRAEVLLEWHGPTVCPPTSFGRSVARVVRRPLTDAEDDELGRPGRRHSDQAYKAAVVEVVLGHGRAVAADEERLLRLPSQESTRRHVDARKASIWRRMVSQSRSLLGSKTAH